MSNIIFQIVMFLHDRFKMKQNSFPRIHHQPIQEENMDDEELDPELQSEDALRQSTYTLSESADALNQSAGEHNKSADELRVESHLGDKRKDILTRIRNGSIQKPVWEQARVQFFKKIVKNIEIIK